MHVAGNTGIAFPQYNAAYRQKRQLYLGILKEFGFGQRLMETRINVEVAEFIGQVKHKDGKPFDPTNMMHMCVVNVIISVLIGKRYPYGHPNLADINDRLRKAFGAVDLTLELFPILRYLPPFRARLQRWQNIMDSLLDVTEKEV